MVGISQFPSLDVVYQMYPRKVNSHCIEKLIFFSLLFRWSCVGRIERLYLLTKRKDSKYESLYTCRIRFWSDLLFEFNYCAHPWFILWETRNPNYNEARAAVYTTKWSSVAFGNWFIFPLKYLRESNGYNKRRCWEEI